MIVSGCILAIVFTRNKKTLITIFGGLFSGILALVGFFSENIPFEHRLFADFFFKVSMICVFLIVISTKSKIIRYFGLMTMAIILNIL